MRFIFIIISFLSVFSLKIQACYQAELYKIYPIGISSDTIISIDMHILRYNAGFFKDEDRITGNAIDEGFRDNEEFANFELEWIIRTYITRYDKSQNKIDSIPLDSARFYTENEGNTIDKLKILYDRGFNQIISDIPHIEPLKPVAIEFCDYSDECKNLIKENSSIINQKDIDYLTTDLRDKPTFDFQHLLKSQRLLLMVFSSVRKYTSSLFDLIVINSQIGQIYGDEPMPQISLGDDIKSAIYEEPILYHGHGNDIFFTKP